MFLPRESVSRRAFLSCCSATAATSLLRAQQTKPETFRDFLKPYVVKKESLDRFRDPKARVWARFDPELGYLLRNSFVRDGVDGCSTLSRYETSGERKRVNFPDQSCRINTYGNSFTQGHQVSDGETWQEILAAHFCEPIRNFGVGGFGVYQAYKRLLRTEATDQAANHLVFNIWGDDHYRSIYAWRWLSFPKSAVDAMSGFMFHANPWVHARLTEQGKLVEKANLCPTADSLDKLSDLDFLEQAFRDDEIVHLMFAERTGRIASKAALDRVAAVLKVKELERKDEQAVSRTARTLLHQYAVTVGMRIMDQLDAYCKQQKKSLIVLLSYPVGAVWHACSRSKLDAPGNVDWHPEVFKRHLADRKIPYVDTVQAHVAEFDTFKLSAKHYVDRYYIGHYNPRGNHFFAYAVKDPILKWLDPKPPAYRTDEEPLIRFKGYLPG